MLTSERIQLRKMVEADIPLYHSWRNNMQVMKTTNLYLDTYDEKDTDDFVRNVILSSPTSKTYMCVDRSTQVVFGVVALTQIDWKNRHAECIIDLGNQDFWGKGYGTEAMHILLIYAFLELNLHRVHLRVFSFNEAGIRLYEKLGFVHEGTARESLFRDGKWHSIISMGMLQSEYIKEHQRVEKGSTSNA